MPDGQETPLITCMGCGEDFPAPPGWTAPRADEGPDDGEDEEPPASFEIAMSDERRAKSEEFAALAAIGALDAGYDSDPFKGTCPDCCAELERMALDTPEGADATLAGLVRELERSYGPANDEEDDEDLRAVLPIKTRATRPEEFRMAKLREQLTAALDRIGSNVLATRAEGEDFAILVATRGYGGLAVVHACEAEEDILRFGPDPKAAYLYDRGGRLLA